MIARILSGAVVGVNRDTPLTRGKTITIDWSGVEESDSLPSK